MTAPTPTTPTTSIHPETEVGLLSLTVSDLARSLDFYTEGFGFEVLQRGDRDAVLGAGGKPLLLLTEESGASAWPRDRQSYTGLYHFAILLPTREDLGRWLRHWLEIGFPVPGQGDHIVSEALYLEDPDGHGIEIYRDRPRDTWTWEGGRIRMGTGPVDIQGLLNDAAAAGQSWTGLPAGTKLGHMHLQVGDIPQASAFYHKVLGFDIVAQMPSALFISAGGYHHHIGMNTWHSRGQGPAPDGIVNLRFFTVDLPDEEAREAVLARLDAAGITYTRRGDVVVVQDPWRNTIVLQIGSAADAAATAAIVAGV